MRRLNIVTTPHLARTHTFDLLSDGTNDPGGGCPPGNGWLQAPHPVARSRTTRGRVVRDHSLRRHDGRIPDEPDTVAADLVEYLIVEVPDLGALASLVPALVELVASAKIRILDLVALEKDADGAVAALELDAVDSMTALKDVDGDVGGMLSQHDIELVSLALRPGTAGIVLVTEDRWAEPLVRRHATSRRPDPRRRAHPGVPGRVRAHRPVRR